MYSRVSTISIITWEFDPEVVGVEDAELLDRLEVLDVLLGHLRHLQQPQLPLVLDQGAALHVRPRLVRHLNS